MLPLESMLGLICNEQKFQYNFAHWPAPSVSRREVESRCLPGDSSQLEGQIRHIPHHSTSFTVVLIFIFISGMQRFGSRHIATILGHEPEQTWAVNSEVPWPATSVDSHGIAMVCIWGWSKYPKIPGDQSSKAWLIDDLYMRLYSPTFGDNHNPCLRGILTNPPVERDDRGVLNFWTLLKFSNGTMC